MTIDCPTDSPIDILFVNLTRRMTVCMKQVRRSAAEVNVVFRAVVRAAVTFSQTALSRITSAYSRLYRSVIDRRVVGNGIVKLRMTAALGYTMIRREFKRCCSGRYSDHLFVDRHASPVTRRNM